MKTKLSTCKYNNDSTEGVKLQFTVKARVLILATTIWVFFHHKRLGCFQSKNVSWLLFSIQFGFRLKLILLLQRVTMADMTDVKYSSDNGNQ